MMNDATKLVNNLEKVTNYKEIIVKSSQINDFQQLYVETFPDAERREWGEMLALMDGEPRFRVLAACDGELLKGVITFWTFPQFTYVEHLAVQPHLRGHGAGGQLLQQAARVQSAPLLLEVEPPVDEITRRRVRFYNRWGLVLRRDVDYVQPPYAPGKPSVPMCIMTVPDMTTITLQAAVATLQREVYGVGK